MSFYYKLLSVFVIILSGCSKQETKDDLFLLLATVNTGLDFENRVIEHAEFNLFTWKYIYNGGGVAIGDINNDGLEDIYFSANQGTNKLFLNKGNMRFEDITASAKVSAGEGYKTGVAMVDLNGDGWLDLFVCRDVASKPELRNNLVFINQQNNTFKESAMDLGLEDQSFTTQALFLDIDRDNDLDVFLINHPAEFETSLLPRIMRDEQGNQLRNTKPVSKHTSNRLFINEGGFFVDKTVEAGLDFQGFGLSALALDINQDGWPDIFVANDFLEPDLVYINQKDGTFRSSAEEYFNMMPQNSMGSAWQDINGDGLFDLVVTDMLAETNYRQKIFATSMWYDRFERWKSLGYGSQVMRNMLYLNRGNGQFSEIGQLAGLDKSDWSWSVILQDFNLDGNREVFISNGILRDMSDSDFIAFYADSLMKVQQKGIEGFYKEDFHQLLEKIPSTPLPNHLYFLSDNLKFDNLAKQSGLGKNTFTQGAAWSDLDNDGAADLVWNNTNQPAMLVHNQAGKITKNHFIKIKLQGPGQNSSGVGSTVKIEQSGKQQTHYFNPYSGYLSSQSHYMLFGLAEYTQPVDVTVTWPDGVVNVFKSMTIDGLHLLAYDSQKHENISSSESTHVIDRVIHANLTAVIAESDFVDFKREPLLLWKESRLGPCLATADVNLDGLADVFIGGPNGTSARLLINKGNDQFEEILPEAFIKDAKHEDVGAVFVDFNGDGYPDLFVASGGNESLNPADYLHRLYLNDQKGNFILHQQMDLSISAGCVATYGKQEDLMIFIGGRQLPGQYGKTVESYLLNKHADQLVAITSFQTDGMVSDAVFAPIFENDLPELVLVGHWMSPQIWGFTGDNYEKIPNTGLEKHHGWWNTLKVRDVNGDGNLDIIAGNMGLNMAFQPSENSPIRLFVHDFDGNGITESLPVYKEGNKEYPIARYEIITKWFPSIKKKFPTFHGYANAAIDEIFDKGILEKSVILMVNEAQSGVFIHKDGHFHFQPFPAEAQFSPIYDFIINPIGDSKNVQVLAAGNQAHVNMETGPSISGKGLLLEMEGRAFYNTHFQFQHLTGDIRGILQLPDGGIIIGENNAPIKLIRLNTIQ